MMVSDKPPALPHSHALRGNARPDALRHLNFEAIIAIPRWLVPIVVTDTKSSDQVQPGSRAHCRMIWPMFIAIAFVAAFCFGESAAHAAERPPNVVMIVADDQGWTDFGFM